MENTIVSGNRRTFRATLFGVIVPLLGGTALAATAPTVAPLKFEYTAKDANGNTITLENKIITGYEANRVAVDASGNVYVSDAVSNTVSVFNTNGRLVRQLNINRAFAVGVDDLNDRIYVGGALNGTRSVFTFDKGGNAKGPLTQFAWGTPSAIAVGLSGDVYVADGELNLVRRLSAKGVSEEMIYGPYGGEMKASEIFSGSGTVFYRTRHRMISPQGLAVDEANGLLYLSTKEYVETLDETCKTVSMTVDGTTKADGVCYNDTEESWRYYNDGMTSDGSKITTASTYKYWNPVTSVLSATQFHILVIDINVGTLTKKITIGDGSDTALIPRGFALDGNGRLYVATVGGGTTGGQIKVYNLDVSPIAALSVSGFASGMHRDVAFSPDVAGAPRGRLFATTGDSKTVSSYSIDGGTNPANTAPTKPELLEPVSLNGSIAVVNTSLPTLKIKNATDAENDPITYNYEICSGSCTAPAPVKVTSAAEITGGADNETSMTVTQELADSLYHWRTQSFDGEKATWSDETTFCVDEVNSIPTDPGVIYPKGEIVSSFSSSLSWTASTDSDCANDIVTYEVTVSDSQGNIVKALSGVGGTSINVSDISGLVNGGTYNWTVRAADNKGGNSGYSSGSFTYMTTSVTLDSDQAGTKVYIDGNYGYYGKLLGAVPVEKSGIAPGSHFVTFINAGYEPYYAIINVTDPAVNAANSSETYTATMVNASRIKTPATGSDLLGAAIAGGYSSLFIVDHDNDGVKDAIIGGGDGKVSLYRAAKDDTTGKMALVLDGVVKADNADINVGSRPVPFAADYDNDGYQDILVGSGDGTVRLYKGTEGGFTDAGVLALKESDGNGLVVANAAPAVVDYNNDGKKDLVVGSSDGTLRLYINTGSDESPVFDVPAAIKADGSDLNAGSNSRAFFTDWNSDGKKDLVVGDGSGKASLFFNIGTDDAPEFRSISGLQQWIKEKKKERGNREFVPYLGYNQDLGDLAGGKFEASPFVVDWEGTSARDIIVGNGSGSVSAYITE